MTFCKDKVKGIIFDYGGTIDSNGDHWSWVIWKFYKKKGISVTFQSFKDAYVYTERFFAKHEGIISTDNFLMLLQKKILKQFEFLVDSDLLSVTWLPLVDEIALACYTETKQLIESEISLLSKLSQHYPMVIVSNFYGNLLSVLDDFKILNFFEAVIESSVVGLRKPDMKIFQLGIETLNLKPSEVVVIGDSYEKDILPANRCGCKTIWIKGLTWREDEISNKSLADVEILNFHELENLFNLQ